MTGGLWSGPGPEHRPNRALPEWAIDKLVFGLREDLGGSDTRKVWGQCVSHRDECLPAGLDPQRVRRRGDQVREEEGRIRQDAMDGAPPVGATSQLQQFGQSCLQGAGEGVGGRCREPEQRRDAHQGRDPRRRGRAGLSAGRPHNRRK